MPKQFINDKTYVCVLNARSHARLGDTARSIFSNIPQKTAYLYNYGIENITFLCYLF